MENVRNLRKTITTTLLFLLLILVTLSVNAAKDQNELDFSRQQSVADAGDSASWLQATNNIAASTTPVNCRYGNSVLYNYQAQLPWLETLGSGWYLNFESTLGASTPNARYNRIVRVSQDKVAPWSPTDVYDPARYLQTYRTVPSLDTLGSLAAATPGETWIIGNEPDRWKIQDDTHPEIMARAYHDAYYAIKRADSTAQVAFGGLVQVSPARLQYLDIVYNTYQAVYGTHMPVDIWNAHIYPLAERNLDGTMSGAGIALGTDPNLAWYISDGQLSSCTSPTDNIMCTAEHDDMIVISNMILQMRQWMKNHNYQNTPLVLTEVGILYPATYSDGAPFYDEHQNQYLPPRIADFVTNVSNYLETAADANLGYPGDGHKLVQQWSWYALFTDETLAGDSNLVNDNWASYTPGDASALTVIGQRYKTEATNQPLQNNFVVERVGGSGGENVSLSVRIRNNGNTNQLTPIYVTFYSDAAMTNAIGSVPINSIHGCGTSIQEASVTWTPPAGLSGFHQFWVKVDSTDAVAETSETDNTGSGTIFANPTYQLQLPIIQR